MKTNNYQYNGPGFLTLLALLFITLKLLDKIDWSWIWVLAPIWIPFAFVVGIILILLLFFGISLVVAACRS